MYPIVDKDRFPERNVLRPGCINGMVTKQIAVGNV